MRTLIIVCGLALGLSVMPAGVSRDQPPKLTDDELRAEAADCANNMRQFGIVQQAWFEDGLEKAKKVESVANGGHWPPPSSYSWRVVILPAMEQGVLYTQIWKASDGFTIGGNATEAELKKHPALAQEFERMPKWMTLTRWQKSVGKSVYRRLVVPDKPAVFIVVESAEHVPWYSPDDDLTLDEKKPLPKIGGNFAGGTFALCGDGKVRFLPKTLTEKQLRDALLTGKGVPALRVGKDKLKQDIEALDLKGK